MADYWLGVSVGWILGVVVSWWLYRERIKAYKKQVSALERIIELIK